jgi:diguanylate cyclase (GGDEF)-like protein
MQFSPAATPPVADRSPASTLHSDVGWLDRWPITVRLFAATLVALAAIGGVGLVSIALIANEHAVGNQMELLGRAERMLQEAANRRDSVRTNVFAVLLDNGAGEAEANLAHALEEHRRSVVDGLSMAASAPSNLQKALADNQPALTAYLNAATNIARLAREDRAAGLGALPAFQKTYEGLIAANEQVSRLLAERRVEANQKAAYAARARLWIMGLTCFVGFLIVAAAGRVVSISVSRALNRVRAAAHAIADGDLSIRTDAPVNDDVGAVAGAVNQMADTLQTMISRLQSEQEQDAFSRQLSEVLDMADTEADTYAVVARGMEAVSSEMPMELLVADSSRAHLERATSHPVKGAPNCTVESPYGCMAVRRGNPIVFESSDALNACARLRDREGGCISAVCVPLTFMGRSLGVLHATGEAGRPPGAAMVGQLKTLGILAGSRIGTVRAFERTQVQASTDVLTGLLNRRSLESRVRRFVRNAPYAVVIADVDHFKRLNDTHGHEAGDRVLKVFADVLRRSVRDGDHAARWGGEEFMIVLEGRDALAGFDVVERIRTNLTASCQVNGVPSITASFGISDTTMASDFEQLIRIADDALYQSKEAGRNRGTIGDALRVNGPVPRREADVEHFAAIEVENLSGARDELLAP